MPQARPLPIGHNNPRSLGHAMSFSEPRADRGAPRENLYPVRRSGRVALVAALAAFVAVAGCPATRAGAVQPRPGTSVPEILVARGALGTVSKYLFGANLLWADNAEGAFDPKTQGWYPEFLAMLKRLGITALRYPAGITSDSFDWLRAIGPENERLPNEPYGMQAASLSAVCCLVDGPAPSTVGPDEFGTLLALTGISGDIAVNFATGTVQEAADFVSYMTGPLGKPTSDPDSPGYWAALRAKDGHPAPYNVPYWEVGNDQYFPGQYGWRSGTPVAVGPHRVPCPQSEVATCLYAFGGTTEFTNETVGTFADELPSASYSTGAPDQTFYAYFPPVVPGSATVYVGGQPWAQVATLAGAGPTSQVYTLDPETGAIGFGDGVHGEVPPPGTLVTASYKSGPHAGFVEFYRAMKAMDPKAQICETEGANAAFLQLMGHTYPYDCIELHLYAGPRDFAAPLSAYEQELLAYPTREADELANLQREARIYSGHNIPVVVTEYGQLVKPTPLADPDFNLTLDEGLLTAVQLMEFARHGVGLAEKYLADSTPFSRDEPTAGLSVDSAMVADRGSSFVAEPSGMAIGLMSRLAGASLLPTSALASPLMGPGDSVPALWALAALGPPARPGGSPRLLLAVVNGEPSHGTRADVVLAGLRHSRRVTAQVLDGPTAATYDTPAWPDLVGTKTYTTDVQSGRFSWYFPAHSLTLLVVHASAVSAPLPTLTSPTVLPGT